ncbi:MAG: triose-phosphate isomerase [Chloroflexota bacterium]
MTRTPIIAANWKMNTTVAEAGQLVQSMIPDLVQVPSVDRVICPPFISLTTVAEYLLGTGIRTGAQNCHSEPKGAYTGEVSAPMLKGLADYVILGHSERRQYFHETDEAISRKLAAVFDAGLLPILCVGERLEENESGQTREVIQRQLRGALDTVQRESMASLVVAYEPVWAIGTGRAATPDQANEVIGFIRSTLTSITNSETSSAIRIQYGGSVTAENFESIIRQPEIDGALVGGASLNAAAFGAIVRLAAS